VRLGFNEFRGQRKVRLLVEDWRDTRPEEIDAEHSPPVGDAADARAPEQRA
jgi:hypothetical protein